MVFLLSLNDSKSPQVFKTRLSILADLKNTEVSMVSTCLLTSKSSSSLNQSLVTVQSAPNTTSITITFMFHRFFSSLSRLRYLRFFFSLSFIFSLWSAGIVKSTIQQFFFGFCLLSLGQVVWPKLGNPFVSQNPREVFAFHFSGPNNYH